MDTTREDIAGGCAAYLRLGFNPHSNGHHSGSLSSLGGGGGSDNVSILILMDTTREVDEEERDKVIGA